MTTTITLPRAPTARGDQDAQATQTISASQLCTWLWCPLRYRLRYVDGIEQPQPPGLFFSRRVHEALAYFYGQLQQGRRPEAGEAERHLEQRWDEAAQTEQVAFGSSDESHQLKRQAADVLSAYLAARDPNEGRPLLVDARLSCPLVDPQSGKPLQLELVTTVDLVLDLPGGPVPVDFKAAARFSSAPAIAQEIPLTCLALVCRHALGIDESHLEIRHLIRTKRPRIEAEQYERRSRVHVRRLLAAVEAWRADLERGRWCYRPSWSCSMCDYRDTHCLQWQP